jgi:hypothetical protein
MNVLFNHSHLLLSTEILRRRFVAQNLITIGWYSQELSCNQPDRQTVRLSSVLFEYRKSVSKSLVGLNPSPCFYLDNGTSNSTFDIYEKNECNSTDDIIKIRFGTLFEGKKCWSKEIYGRSDYFWRFEDI